MLRQADLSDVSALYKIEKKCFGRRGFSKAHIIWTLKNPQGFTYLYYADGRPVGTVMLRMEGEVGRVVSIGVLPDYRRHGIGGELMRQAEEFMREKGARHMLLEVGVENDEAVAFYERLGYETDGVLKGYYSWGEDAHLMRKALPPLRDV
ncbi:MAG: GNAT family N-acetyltransferase [Thermoplasmata archaeon]